MLGTAHGLGLRLVAASVSHGCWVWPLRASGVCSCAVEKDSVLRICASRHCESIHEFVWEVFYDQTCIRLIASCSWKSCVRYREPADLGEVKGLLETLSEYNFVFRCSSFLQEKEIQVHETSWDLGKGPRKYQGWSALSMYRLFGNWFQLQGLDLDLGPNSL